MKEVGTALAVLAIYSLMLLAPWHQASALQHELADLGYATVGVVDICGPAAGSGDEAPSEFKCHVVGIGKFDFAAIAPAGAELSHQPVALTIVHGFDEVASRPSLARHFGQARAPPVTV